VVTITLIAVCVAVAVVGMVWPSGDLTGTLGFMPILARHEPWRWLTSMFDHLGLMHLAMNMICLWMLGVFLEPALGRWRFTALYLLSGLGGGTAILAWTAMGGLSLDWFGLSAGASGAVFGLFGATVWVMRRLGGNLRGILVVLGINLVFTVANTATVAWQAHIGGLLVGLALGAVYAYAPRARARLFSLLGTAGAVVVVVGVYLAISTAIPNLAGLL
jgi:membrane associated rhomboid family serine protease